MTHGGNRIKVDGEGERLLRRRPRRRAVVLEDLEGVNCGPPTPRRRCAESWSVARRTQTAVSSEAMTSGRLPGCPPPPAPRLSRREHAAPRSGPAPRSPAPRARPDSPRKWPTKNDSSPVSSPPRGRGPDVRARTEESASHEARTAGGAGAGRAPAARSAPARSSVISPAPRPRPKRAARRGGSTIVPTTRRTVSSHRTVARELDAEVLLDGVHQHHDVQRSPGRTRRRSAACRRRSPRRRPGAGRAAAGP